MGSEECIEGHGTVRDVEECIGPQSGESRGAEGWSGVLVDVEGSKVEQRGALKGA